MKKDKPTGITIILLFILFLSISIYGGILKLNNEEVVIENTNQDFYFNGSLYFYSDANELLGTYECKTLECGYAQSSDETFIDYYYVSENDYEIGIISNSFVILQDGEEIFIYNFSLNSIVVEFEDLKYYNTSNSENIILVKENGFWGARSLTSLLPDVEVMYDELSIANNVVDGLLDSSHLLAKFNNEYFIVDNLNNTLSVKFSSEIVDYTNDFIITYDEFYHVFDYEGNELLNYELSYYTKSENYYVFVYNNYVLIYDDLFSTYINYITISDYEEISIIESNDGTYAVYVDGESIY